MMKPSSTENPVASTPKTPEARSPSEKKLPSGARRRTNSIAETVTAQAPAVIRTPQTMFIGRRESHSRSGWLTLARQAGDPVSQKSDPEQQGDDVADGHRVPLEPAPGAAQQPARGVRSGDEAHERGEYGQERDGREHHPVDRVLGTARMALRDGLERDRDEGAGIREHGAG